MAPLYFINEDVLDLDIWLNLSFCFWASFCMNDLFPTFLLPKIAILIVCNYGWAESDSMKRDSV
jgi:hypothetical protein